MKFLHAADIHLDSPLLRVAQRSEGTAGAALKDCTRRAFVDMIDLAIDEDVAFVMIAGDLYDADWKDYSTGLFFAEQMKRLDRPCFIVRGNHDAQSVITRSLHPPGNVHIFSSRTCETVTLPDFGVAIHGRSFPDRAVSEDLAVAYPPRIPGLVNIGLLHTSAEGSADHDTYAPCTVSTLLSKEYDYWALGHVHARQVLHKDPWVVFPGNLQGRSIRETGAKGCAIVEIEDGRVVTVEHRVVDVLRWASLAVDATRADDITELLDRIRQGLADAVKAADSRPLLVRVVLSGTTSLHGGFLADPDAIDAECRSAALTISDELWIESVQVDTAAASLPSDRVSAGDALAALSSAFLGALDDVAVSQPLLADLKGLVSRLPASAVDSQLRVPRNEAALKRFAPDTWEIVARALASGEIV